MKPIKHRPHHNRPISTRAAYPRWLALPVILLGGTVASTALARPNYSNDVANWCASAGRPAPTQSLLNCDTCHGNKTPFRNLRSAPSNASYLNYFCKASAKPTNKAPVISVASTANAVEGTPLTLAVNASDPDGNAVTLVANGLPQGASFNTASGQFTWTPAPGTAAATPTVLVNFAATDKPTNGAAALTSKASVTIHLAATAGTVNNPPVIAPIADQNAYVGQTLSFQVVASDKDGDTISLTAAGQPLSLGASFDPATGVFSWTPTAAQISAPATPYTLTVTATDDFASPASSTETIAISVNPASNGTATLTRLAVQTAAWNNKLGKLSVSGKLAAATNPIPAGLTVDVWDGDTNTLLGSGSANKKGSWSVAVRLGQDASPCSVRVESGGLSATKKVARSGCGTLNTGTGNSGRRDDDDGRDDDHDDDHGKASKRDEGHGHDD